MSYGILDAIPFDIGSRVQSKFILYTLFTSLKLIESSASHTRLIAVYNRKYVNFYKIIELLSQTQTE